MEDFLDKRKVYKNGAPLSFIIGCMLGYNFNSFKNFLIYIFHYSGFLDLRQKPSSEYSDEQIINTLSHVVKQKVRKKDLCILINLCNTTFNKVFKEYIDKNKLKGRRTYTIYETYKILNYWQGEGKWARLNSIKKETISGLINAGNYKKTASEFHVFKDDIFYKGKDKFSPKEIKEFINHIELNENGIEEKLMGYEDLKSMSLWMFGAVLASTILHRSTTHNNENKK